MLIDPTVVFNTAQECYMQGGTGANTNFCGGTTLNVGFDSTQASRTLLQFDLSSIPPNAQVLNAALSLSLTAATTTNTSVGLYHLTQAWTTATTWTSADGVTAWSTPGGTFAAAADYTNSSVGGAAGTAFSWYPTRLVQSWVNGTLANRGLLLKEPAENVTTTFQFQRTAVNCIDRGPAADPLCFTVGPSLTVTYEPWVGEQRFYKLETVRLSDRMHLHVNVANGNLVLDARDLGVRGTGLDLGVDRFYNSLAAAQPGAFGNGWVIGVGPDERLSIFNDGSAAFYGPSGFQIPFLKNADGSFSAPTGIDATLRLNPDASYTLGFNRSGEKLNFTSGGQLTSHADKNGNTIAFTYDASGRLASIKDTQARVTTFAYNAAGLVQTMTDPALRQSQYAYDASNNLASYTDAAGKITRFGYDAASNLTQITDPRGNLTTVSYDANHRVGSLTRVTVPATGTGPTTSFTYNAGSTVVTDPNGHQTTYSYDVQGRVVQVVDAAGTTTSLSYTSDSNVAQQTDGTGATRTYGYDALNNLTQTSLPTGASAVYAYADASHPYFPTSATDPQGNTTQYAYDAAGNLVRVTDALNHATAYTYNPNGMLASATDARAIATSFGYDARGNLTGVTYPSPLGAATYAYDALSRLTSATDGKGTTTTYGYDALDRLTRLTSGALAPISLTYDANGNRTALTDRTGATSFTFDALNRMTTKGLPSTEAISYGYDAEGNVTSIADSGGTTVLGYSVVNRPVTVTDPTGARTTFQFDAAYRATQVAYPNGVTGAIARDSAGNLAAITWKNAGGSTLLSRSYSYVNPATNLATVYRYSLTDQNNASVSYTYDAVGRLVQARTVSGGSVTDDRSYTYDAVGNRLSQVVNGITTAYQYDAANELTAAGSSTYTYDADGNLTGRSDGLAFAYDAANFTTSVTPPGASAIPMTYSGLDQTERTQAGTTAFIYELFGPSRRTDASGTVYELRCPCGQLLSERSTSATNYVLFDAVGSTIGLTNNTGGVVATWSYDPFGNLISHTGTATTPFGFQGAYLDQASGLYKVGMRYYDPSVGRWTQLDPVFGNLAQPDTLNRYVFVRNNPLNFTDPTGAFWCGFVCGLIPIFYCLVFSEVPILVIICAILWLIFELPSRGVETASGS